ncbi:MAG: hypothetical protein ACHQ2Y_06070 [Candidatus Lutacidiplasmatales archaeon]
MLPELLLATPGDQERHLTAAIRGATREIDALIRPMALPLSHRLEVAREFGRAVTRRVKVRLVLDYQASELDYLAAILRESPVGAPSLEVRFHGPQLSALYLFDQHQAARLVRSPAMGTPGAHFGISSAEPEFVRLQVARFQSVWRDAVPVAHALRSSEGSVAIPGASFKELRRWVDDVTATEAR